jgi:hypothetical protein
MTVHRDRFLVNKTDALNSKFIGISGSLSAHHQEFLTYIGIGIFYAVLMTVCYQEQDGTPGSKRSSKRHKMNQYRCTAKNS